MYKDTFSTVRVNGEIWIGLVPSSVSCKVVYFLHCFLSRVSTPTRDIDIALLSVSPSVCPSVRDVPVSDENGLTYRHSFFFHHTVAQLF